MLEPTPLEHARAVKLRLRAASKNACEVRKRWNHAAALCKRDILHQPAAGQWGDREKIGDLTVEMWASEAGLAAVADEWRQCLADRATMTKAERWNLAGVERWAEIAAVMERQP